MVEQRKSINWRQVAIFASGLLLGAVLAAWAVLESRAPAAPAVPVASESVAPAPAAPAAEPLTAAALRPRTACPASPAIRAAGAGDGQLRAPGETAGNIGALILAGKEAAASGRPRDAEVSFLSACRAADRIESAGATEPADARYQLGRHYATVLLTGSAAANANRTELLKRAELLYSDSLQAYRARHGEDHEKTRFAAEGLATLRQSSAQAAPATPATPAALPPPKPVIAAAPPQPPPAAPSRQPRVEAPTAPVRQAIGVPNRGRPSFDCGLARSPSERAICSDTELAQLDRDLGRLHSRARDSAGDSAAFRRQNDREWRRREATCQGDRECLREWYERRRDQLLDVLEEDGQ